MSGAKAFAEELARQIAEHLAGSRVQKRVYSLPDAAEYLGVSDETLRRMAINGKIPSVRIDSHHRFDVRDLDLFIDTHKE